MRLPAESATNAARSSFSRYLARRLRRAKLLDEEALVKQSAVALHAAAVAEEEAEGLVQDALADRDADDDTLDDVAKRHRQTIEGRATNANKERPYSDIYPDGIAFYTAAPLTEQASRYTLLVRRYDEHLPDGDPVRAEGGLITAALTRWSASSAGLNQAQLDVAIARGRTARAVEDWEATLNRLYFRLAERLGKTQAERFFPRARRRAAGKDVGDGGMPPA